MFYAVGLSRPRRSSKSLPSAFLVDFAAKVGNRYVRTFTCRSSLGLLAADVLLAAAAMSLSHFLRFGMQMNEAQLGRLLMSAPLYAAICLATFPALGMYAAHWRYPTLLDLVRIPRAVLAASCLHIVAVFFLIQPDGASRLAVVIATFILTTLLFAARFWFRLDDLLSDARAAAGNRGGTEEIPVLLVGVGNAADDFIRALRRDPEEAYQPVGLIGGGTAQVGMTVRGVPILGPIEDAHRIIDSLRLRHQQPRHLFFTEQISEFGEAAATLVELADRQGIAVSRLPRATELQRPGDGTRNLRPIELCDLLERPQAVFDRGSVEAMARGRRVLVTGAGGSIGSEMSLQLAACAPAEIVLVDNCEFNLYRIDMELRETRPAVRCTPVLCDVRDSARVEALFRRCLPELVFHAAALKHVPMVELNPAEGALTNVVGSRNVADAALASGARAMVQVSTDKAVNATSVMGATKRMAELYCQTLDGSGRGRSQTRFMTVRFGNVLGSSGSLVPLFQRQIAAGGPLTVTHPEMTRFFMTIREAVQLTLQTSAHGLQRSIGRGDVFVLDMGKPVRILDIARRMIRLSGMRPDEDISIEIIGCRPGEKLFEELFDEIEEVAPSGIPGVRSAKSVSGNLEVLRTAIDSVASAAHRGDAEAVVRVLEETVRGYRRSAPADGSGAVRQSRPRPRLAAGGDAALA